MEELLKNFRELDSFESIIAFLGLISALISVVGSKVIERFYVASVEKAMKRDESLVLSTITAITSSEKINSGSIVLGHHTDESYFEEQQQVNNSVLEKAIKEIFLELNNELEKQLVVTTWFKRLDSLITFFEYVLLGLLCSGFFLSIISTFSAGIMGLILLILKEVKRAFQLKAKALKAAENVNLLNRIISVVGTQITFLEANSTYAIEREKILMDAKEALNRVRDKMLSDEFVLHQERLLEEKKQEIEKVDNSNNQRNRKKPTKKIDAR